MLDFLHLASRWLEDFSGRHSHIIALLEAVSTTAAVIVALAASYAAKRASRPRLTASVSVMLVIYGDGRPVAAAPSYVTVRLTNVGTMPVRVKSNFFSWRMPFVKTAWLAVPLDATGNDDVPLRRYPFDLLPRTSETIFLTGMDQFKSATPGIINSGRFGSRISARLLRGVVYTDDGSNFRAVLENSYRKELAKLLEQGS